MNKLLLLLFTFILFSCGNTTQQETADTTAVDTTTSDIVKPVSKNIEMFKTKLVVILGAPLESDSSAITLQNFAEKGKSFIPVFTSQEKYKESTGGAEVGKGAIEIDGIFLLSMLKGEETLRLNPTLDDEQYFNSSFLIQNYQAEIDSIRKQMQLNKK